jgi:LysM repeat protein
MQNHSAVVSTSGTNERRKRSVAIGSETHPRRLTFAECAILSIAVVCIAAVALYPGIRTRVTSWPSTVTIKVTEAETLWGIAKSHPIEGLSTAETVAAIRLNNDLADSGLQQGQLLRVPGEAASETAMASR